MVESDRDSSVYLYIYVRATKFISIQIEHRIHGAGKKSKIKTGTFKLATKNTRAVWVRVCMAYTVCVSHSEQNVEMPRECDLVYIWIAIESDAVSVLCVQTSLRL